MKGALKFDLALKMAEEEIADAGTCRPRTPGSDEDNKDRCAGDDVKAGGGTRSYSRRAAGPPPSAPPPRWQGTPPRAGAFEGWAREERGPTFRDAGPSRTVTSDVKRKNTSAPPATPRPQPPQGACLAWKRGR